MATNYHAKASSGTPISTTYGGPLPPAQPGDPGIRPETRAPEEADFPDFVSAENYLLKRGGGTITETTDGVLVNTTVIPGSGWGGGPPRGWPGYDGHLDW